MPASLEAKFKGLSWGLLNPQFGASCDEVARRIRDCQDYARRKTRLAHPLYALRRDAARRARGGRYHLPANDRPSAIWNPELIKEMASAIAKEGRAMGLVQSLSPMLELARDPRWGRVEECFGECPYLVTRMVVAYIQGMQGDDARRELGGRQDVLHVESDGRLLRRPGWNQPCARFVGRARTAFSLSHGPRGRREESARVVCHGVVQCGRRRSRTRESLAVDQSAAGRVGIRRLRGLRRRRSADELQSASRLPKHQGGLRAALRAGVDVALDDPACYLTLPESLREGKITQWEIDQAVARVLHAKFVAGLFDGNRDPLPVAELGKHIRTADNVALSRRMAEESIILLKNEGHLLPLDAAKLKSIAVIGPNADQVQFGDYCWSKSNKHGVSVLRGLRELIGDKVRLKYAKGCDLMGLSTDGFASAVKAAEESDLSVVVIGDTSMILSGVGWEDPSLPSNGTVGEGYDVTDPVPPGVQQELVEAICKVGKPTVVVMLHGRPYSMPWMKEHVPAILSAFYPGEQQGHAIADVLLGRVNPSGRLPVSVAQSAGHIPTVYDWLPLQHGIYHKPGSPQKPGRDYVFSTPDPLWSFGYGLSYTTFGYSKLQIDTPTIPTSGTARLSVTSATRGSARGRKWSKYTITTSAVRRSRL